MPQYPGYEEALQASRYLRRRPGEFPRVAIVLGTGHGVLAENLGSRSIIPYRRIPHFARPGVRGHAGALHLGRWGKVPVAILQARVHLYEGYAPAAVVFPVRALGLAGVKTLILTCAAGGIAPRAAPGSLMLFSDHLNLQGSSPLAGPAEERWGPRFPDLSAAYDLRLRRLARAAARELRLKCFEGVYAAVRGPNYETPAEIRALKRWGADAVGMSTVPEVIAARQMGLEALAIAAISNRAAGLAKGPLGHEDVLAAGRSACRDLARLLGRVLRALPESRRPAATRKRGGSRGGK